MVYMVLASAGEDRSMYDEVKSRPGLTQNLSPLQYELSQLLEPYFLVCSILPVICRHREHCPAHGRQVAPL